MSYNEQDIKYMQRAIELAKKGAGFVNPNPMVGCVIVKDDKIIGLVLSPVFSFIKLAIYII